MNILLKTCCSIIGFGVIFMACSTETSGTATPEHPAFFDLSVFVKRLAKDLQQKEIEKTVEVNGLSQTLKIDSVNWADELAPFAQSNLNRPAFWDKDRVDSLREGDRTIITYSALDSSLFTRTLRIEKLDTSPVFIQIHNRFSSLIANTSQHLEWGPRHYEIYSEQYVKFGDDRVLKIRGAW